jgi:dTDP-4-amino-4,6-dideoxygalactose transaminase
MGKILQVPFVDLAAQYAAITPEIDQATKKILCNTDFILGQDVGLFEEEFAAYCEVRYAVGLDSGTSALELLLRAYEIGPGDEVITAANTFIATAFAISYAGATPVLVDIDPHTYNIDASRLEDAITPRTRAIMPVHLYGQPADMDPIMEIARQYNLVVIEDACQAHGARYKGRRVGSIGHAAAFSFYPAKNLGAYGDGGLAVTHDEQVAKTLRMLRDYGQSKKYHHIVRGYNHRLDTLQAAVLRVKLPYLDSWNAARLQHAKLYNKLFVDSPAVTPIEAGYAESVYHLYVIRINNRDELQAHLKAKGIATGIHYPVPIHLQPAYQDLGYQPGDFPVSERYAKQILSLPMYAELTSRSIEHVTQAIKDFVASYYDLLESNSTI